MCSRKKEKKERGREDGRGGGEGSERGGEGSGEGGKEEETVQGNFLWLTSQMTWPEDKQEIKAQANGRNCCCLTGRLLGCGGRNLPESRAGRAALTQSADWGKVACH